MSTSDLITTALTRCPAVQARTLEAFLDTLLDQDLETLAQLPGTPGQVMAAQFTHYVRSSVQLTETLHRSTDTSQRLQDLVLHMPQPKTTRSRRRSADGSNPRSSEAAA
jgi:hypothetical protein